MFSLRISDGVIAHASRLVAGTNFGRRGVGDGTQEQQFVGLVGQTVLHDLFGIPRPEDLGRADGGVDFTFAGVTVDVKTMGRNGPTRIEWVSNFQASQRRFDTDVLVFCNFNNPGRVLTICGWIAKKDFFEKASFYPAGTLRTRDDGVRFRLKADTYEIMNRDLHRPGSLFRLKEDLQGLAQRQGRSELPEAA